MRKQNEELTRLALLGNVSNTLGGGMSEPVIKIHKLEDSHVVELKIPGVKEESIQVEIHNNWLTIFQILKIKTLDVFAPVPRIVYSKQIPYFVDVEAIDAKFENGQLVVCLPFNKRANGFHRRISIKQ